MPDNEWSSNDSLSSLIIVTVCIRGIAIDLNDKKQSELLVFIYLIQTYCSPKSSVAGRKRIEDETVAVEGVVVQLFLLFVSLLIIISDDFSNESFLLAL